MALVSLWQDLHPRAVVEPTDVEGSFDVVVVGAGITGLTTALLLGRAGKSVAVLEAAHVGAGTTGGSTAKVSLLQGTRLSSIARRHPHSVVHQYVEANIEAQAWLARFCADHEVAVQTRPAYTYATTARGQRLVRRELELARGAGLGATWVDAPDLPFATQGAARLADQLQVDPVELLDELSLEAASHGVRIIEGARVRTVDGTSPVRVATSAGTLSAQIAVIATNMPILDRGGFFARMVPARSYGLAFDTSRPAVDGMYLAADSPARSLRDAPRENGSRLLVGGAGHTTGRGGSTLARLDELRAWTAEHFDDPVETHAWSAQDYLPAHQLPYAGPVLPGADHVLVAGGYAKWGMTNGVAAALALSSQILGGRMDWAEVLRSWGAHELRGVVDGVRANAEVGFHMTRGWLVPLRHPGIGPTPAEGQGTVRYDHPGAPTAQSVVDGVERRVSGVCSHLGGIVRWNDAERSWDCPLHGSRFGPDGAVREGPATCGLSQR